VRVCVCVDYRIFSCHQRTVTLPHFAHCTGSSFVLKYASL